MRGRAEANSTRFGTLKPASDSAQWRRRSSGVTAVVVLESGSEVSPDELRRHCAEFLAGFKVPKRVELASALPRTPSGKVMRRALR